MDIKFMYISPLIARTYIRHEHNPNKLQLTRETERKIFSEREFSIINEKKLLSFLVSVAHRLPFCEGKLVLSSEKNTGLKGKKSYGEENISIKK